MRERFQLKKKLIFWFYSTLLTSGKCCELVLPWIGWKKDIFCQIMCPVQLVIHVDEGPGGDGSKCVCLSAAQQHSTLIPAAPEVSRCDLRIHICKRRGIFFFLMAISHLWRCQWVVLACSGMDDLEKGSPILSHNCPTCNHMWLSSLPWRISRVLQPPLAPSLDAGTRHQGLNLYYTSQIIPGPVLLNC